MLDKLKQVRNLREGILLNRGAILKGEPDKEYCWVNIDPERRIFYEQMGWELVKVDPTHPKVQTHWKPREDGTLVRGDLILYQIDKELFEAMSVYNVARGLELTENAGQDFESMLERLGAPSYKPKV